MWSHDVIGSSLTLAADLKIGQYLKIPPRVMFLTQVWGTLVGQFRDSFVVPFFYKKKYSDPTIYLQAPLSTMVINYQKKFDSKTKDIYFSGDGLRCRQATRDFIESNRNQCMERTGNPDCKQRCSDMVSCETTIWV